MKILLLNQFFWPDNSATSQLLTDLARGLTSAGHEVTAICSDKGYVSNGGSTAPTDTPPVTVIRVKALPFVRGKLGRVLSYLTFYLAAATRSLTLPRQDMVLTLTTPPLLPLLGTLVKRLRRTRHFIWEMDMYPDVAVDLDYFKKGGAARPSGRYRRRLHPAQRRRNRRSRRMYGRPLDQARHRTRQDLGRS